MSLDETTQTIADTSPRYIQGDSNQNLLIQIAITLTICIFVLMMVHSAVSKFQDFCIAEILRKINFKDSRVQNLPFQGL